MQVPFNSFKSLVCSYFDGTLSPDAQLQNETFQNTKRQRKARVDLPLAVLGSAIVWQVSLLTRGFHGYQLNNTKRKKLPSLPWLYRKLFDNTESMDEDNRLRQVLYTFSLIFSFTPPVLTSDISSSC